MSDDQEPTIEKQLENERDRRASLEQTLAGVHAGVRATAASSARIGARTLQNHYGKELELSVLYRPTPRTA